MVGKLVRVLAIAVAIVGLSAFVEAPASAAAPGVYSDPEWFPLRSTDLDPTDPDDLRMGCARTTCTLDDGSAYHGYHALDVGGQRNQPVYAAGAGQVVRVYRDSPGNCGEGKDACQGNYVTIDHGNRQFSFYTHFTSIPSHIQQPTPTSDGTWVDPNTVIGYLGDTGRSTPGFDHLHFEVRTVPRTTSDTQKVAPGRLKVCDGGQLVELPAVNGTMLDSWDELARGTPLVNEGTSCTDEAFHIAKDGRMFHAWQTEIGGLWSDWSQVPGSATDLAVAAGGNGALELFHVGGEGRVFHKWQYEVGGGWSDWNEVAGLRARRLAVEANADGRLELFAVGTDGHLHHRWQHEPNGGWSGWRRFYDGSYRDVAVAPNADGRLEVYTAGGDGRLAHRWQRTPGADWTAWADAGVDAATVDLARNEDGRLEVLAVGSDGAMSVRWQTAPNAGWSRWNGVAGDASRVAMARDGEGLLHAFHIGDNGIMWEKWQLYPSAAAPTGITGHGGPAPGAPGEETAPATAVTGACRGATSDCDGTALRRRPGTTGAPVFPAAIPDDQRLDVFCRVAGDPVSGGFGSSSVWYHTNEAGHSGFVPAAHAQVTAGDVPACYGIDAPIGHDPSGGASTFSDISGSVHEAAIERIVAAGITAGYPDGTFRPDRAVTRGQTATFLVQALEQ